MNDVKLSDAEVNSSLEDLRAVAQAAVASALALHVHCKQCGAILGEKSRKLLAHERRLAALDIVLAERRERIGGK